MMVTRVLRAVCAAAAFGAAAAASAAPVFDFGTSSRTLLSTLAAPPGLSSFADLPAFGTELFTVGNLFNGCGLWTGVSAVRTRSGTQCPLSAHNTSNPASFLSKKIIYEDTFTVEPGTNGVLQIMVKLGHPENWPSSRNQNQNERFNIFLENPSNPAVPRRLLANFLDDVDNRTPGVEDDAYYRYVFAAAELPTGTWRPVFESVSGSIEFVTRLSGPTPVPEPGTTALLVAGLLGVGWIGWRRRG